MWFIIVLFIVFVGGGWVIGKAIGKALFGQSEDKYIDKSVNYYTENHYHSHEHKNITIIDEQTREKILELKERKDE